jgi:hypothetical protein
MPPTLVLCNYLRDASSWPGATNQTSQFQAGNFTIDTSAVGFIVPLAIFLALLAIILGGCV